MSEMKILMGGFHGRSQFAALRLTNSKEIVGRVQFSRIWWETATFSPGGSGASWLLTEFVRAAPEAPQGLPGAHPCGVRPPVPTCLGVLLCEHLPPAALPPPTPNIPHTLLSSPPPTSPVDSKLPSSLCFGPSTLGTTWNTGVALSPPRFVSFQTRVLSGCHDRRATMQTRARGSGDSLRV